MTHQNPAIKKAMQSVLGNAGINYWFMDDWGGICCGRPMMLAGHKEQAEIMMGKNRKLIGESGAGILVTSCPICYKVFAKDYGLNIRVMHHSQYLLELVNNRQLTLDSLPDSAVYHDPCELSRDIRIYDEPRKLLGKVLNLVPNQYERNNSLCCGNSLANFSASNEIRLSVARDAYTKLNSGNAQLLVTSCPMCKKAFEKVSEVPVRDIAEIVSKSVHKSSPRIIPSRQRKVPAKHNVVIQE
jgi:Fe-S oxidoreductase